MINISSGLVQSFVEDGTSLANWTSVLGSWSVASSAFKVTCSSLAFGHLRYTSRVPQSGFIFQADVKIESGGGFGADNRVGLRFKSDGGTGGTGAVVFMRCSGTLNPSSTGGIYTENPFGTLAGAHLSNNFNLDQYYNLKVVVVGSVMDIYVDGNYITSRIVISAPSPATAVESGSVTLTAYNCIADYKNIKLYSVATLANGINLNAADQIIISRLCEGRLTLAPGKPFYNPQQRLVSTTDTTAETCTLDAAHGWVTGTTVTAYSTSGGLTANTTYYVNVVNSTTVSFHTTLANAIAGTSKVNLTSSVASWIIATGIFGQSIYFSPLFGGQIGLYDGVSWVVVRFTEAQMTAALGTLTIDTNYNVWAYLSSGTPAIEFSAWGSANSNLADLTTQDGVLVKSGAVTRRFLGSFRTQTTTATCMFRTFMFVSNYYNRKMNRVTRRGGPGASHTYNSTTMQQVAASTNNQIDVLACVDHEMLIDLEYKARTLNPVAGGNAGRIAFGEGSTANPLAGMLTGDMSPASAAIQTLSLSLRKYLPLGFTSYKMLEFCLNSGGNVTFTESDELDALAAGVNGWVEG